MATSQRAVLHLGLPRAASTSIQRHVFGQLDGRRINKQIPYIGARGHQYAKRIGLSLHADPSGRRARPLIDEAVRFFRAEQARSRRRILFSHEGLCGRPWDAFRSRKLLFDMLRRAFDDPVVLVVVREPFHWIESLYRFSIRANALSPERFLCWDEKRFMREFRRGRKSALHIGGLSLKSVVNGLFETFGSRNVILLDYSELVRDLPRFASEFSDWLGVPPLTDDEERFERIEHQSSDYYRYALYRRPRNQLEELGLYRRKSLHWKDRTVDRTLRMVSEAASVLPGNRRYLLEKYQNRIRRQFAEDYAWVRRQFRRLRDVPLD